MANLHSVGAGVLLSLPPFVATPTTPAGVEALAPATPTAIAAPDRAPAHRAAAPPFPRQLRPLPASRRYFCYQRRLCRSFLGFVRLLNRLYVCFCTRLVFYEKCMLTMPLGKNVKYLYYAYQHTFPPLAAPSFVHLRHVGRIVPSQTVADGHGSGWLQTRAHLVT